MRRARPLPSPCARLTTCTLDKPFLAGVLACLDGYMNIAMEQTEEYVNGQLKAKYGDTFIRGNNGALVPSPSIMLSVLTERCCPACVPCLRSALHQHAEETLMMQPSLGLRR